MNIDCRITTITEYEGEWGEDKVKAEPLIDRELHLHPSYALTAYELYGNSNRYAISKFEWAEGDATIAIWGRRIYKKSAVEAGRIANTQNFIGVFRGIGWFLC